MFDGDLVEVLELDGSRVVRRNVRTGGMLTVGLARLATTAHAAVVEAQQDRSVGPVTDHRALSNSG